MQYSDLMGTEGELLADHKDKWAEDAVFVGLLMNSDVSSHAVPVSSTQHQLQLPETKAMANFTREMWGYDEIPHWFWFRNGISVGE